MRSMSYRVTGILICLLMAGCFGPTAIRQGFEDYSQTLHYNSQQQMLLNLVRLKYRETPFFLKVGALSVNYELQLTGTVGIEDIGEHDSPVPVEIEPTILEKPTVTYTPVEGDVFVRQMLAEIDPSVFVLLVRSGWPVRNLCMIMVEGYTQADGTQMDKPAFQTMIDEMAVAQQQKSLNITLSPDGTNPVLDTGSRRISLSSFRYRSFLDVMYELSKNVQVPDAHEDWVQKASSPNNLIRVESSRLPPFGDYISVKTHGYYFHIAQNDIASKDTFALLQILYQMQAGDIKSVQPVLTLPIGN